MNTLIERLEKATGPDRELDRLIAAHPGTPSCGVVKGCDPEHLRDAEENWDPPIITVPNFTTSIDAAMTLVPEDAGLRLERYWLRDREAWTAVASTGGVPSNPARQFIAEDAHTPAIALCIAALKGSRG